MNPHFSVLGLDFYWYGLIVGLAIALTLILVDYRAALFDRQQFSVKKPQIKSRKVSLQLFFQQWSVVLIVSGFIGARLWHVATDWQKYWPQWQDSLRINQGGLSILGAFAGLTVGLLLIRRFSKTARAVPLLLLADTIVFGVPFGQAVGRLGNWVNQELYGYPSSLPWAIRIDVPHRLVEYLQYEKYHPLFLYESLLMLVLGVFIWWFDRKHSWRFGTGFFALLYVTAYSGIRFTLDFIRLDRPIAAFGLGSNQMVLLAVFMVSLALWFRLWRRGYFKSKSVNHL